LLTVALRGLGMLVGLLGVLMGIPRVVVCFVAMPMRLLHGLVGILLEMLNVLQRLLGVAM
jgi:hypothetical protein